MLHIRLQSSPSLLSDTSPFLAWTEWARPPLAWPSMFRNRNNAQKPDDEFISRFQQTFADIVPRRASEATQHAALNTEGDPMLPSKDNTDSKGDANGMRPFNDRTPRNFQELGFSPSWMDPAALPMMSLASQHPGFYTPNSGGMGAIFHNQVGDLHTPTMGLNMITPLSLSNPDHPPQGHDVEQLNPQFLSYQMPAMNPFATQASYAPSAFMQHQDSGYDAMDESMNDSSVNEAQAELITNMAASTELSISTGMSYARGEKFRYNVSLKAPTAMVKHTKEIPVSYLNKGQAYNLTVMDSTPPIMSAESVRYRSFIRVSFDEEEQRAKPGTCWQLWKEGRGLSEAHHRGGKLVAVEYVDPLQGGGEEYKHRQIQVETVSFDGFCVTWTANPATGTSECTIPVRFNFLSTDFSHSKGVKGIPVRLCAKTEILSPGDDTGAARESEVCYCKVKLFRDHGAERKLSNDVAHVKKTIEKLKQQIAQAEAGGGFGKRKRGHSASTGIKGTDRMKVSKHKRTWSMDSQDGVPEKMSLEDDLQAKLAMMQDMFSSTRTTSVLGLCGDAQDDPDLYPVRLPNDGSSKVKNISRQNTTDSQSMENMILSPSSSNASLHSPVNSNSNQQKRPVTVPKISTDDSNVSTGFIEAVDIDPTYRPPAERPPKPIACFYVRFNGTEEHPQDFYRAVYLSERSVRDMMKKISEKRHIDPARIVRILRINYNGLRIMVDDDVVRELPEGQDMIADISEAHDPEAGGSSVEIKLTY